MNIVYWEFELLLRIISKLLLIIGTEFAIINDVRKPMNIEETSEYIKQFIYGIYKRLGGDCNIFLKISTIVPFFKVFVSI